MYFFPQLNKKLLSEEVPLNTGAGKVAGSAKYKVSIKVCCHLRSICLFIIHSIGLPIYLFARKRNSVIFLLPLVESWFHYVARINCRLIMFQVFMIWLPYWKVDGRVVVLQLDKKAAKPVTTVWDCVSMFVTLKEQDHSVFYIYGSVTPLNTFTGELGTISSLICDEK